MGALSGYTVVDLTQGYGGPFCTMQLADFGANVIKVEKKGAGDVSRKRLPIKNSRSGFFVTYNRGKKSLALDLEKQGGRDILTALISGADVLVVDYEAEYIRDLDLGYDRLAQLNPRLIYASLSGFGEYGSMSSYRAHDISVQAASGTMAMTGFPDDDPVKIGVAVGDSLTGSKLCLGILMALFSRMKTGQGQKIEIAKMDALFEINESPVLFQTVLGQETTRAGNGDATLTPYEIYEAADGFISIGVASESIWPNFCNGMDMEYLMRDERFVTNEKRLENFDSLQGLIKQHVLTKTTEDLQERLAELSVPCAPVLSIAEIMKHPQLKARDMIGELRDPVIGTFSIPGIPIKLEKSPGKIQGQAPELGEHTSEILQSLGYSRDKIEDFKSLKVV